MRGLKALGVASSLDDSGTGHSSWSYLRQLLIDSIKIDIALVTDMPANADAIAITTAVSMAQTLGLRTIAEGVEEEAQATMLKNLGVGLYQGYLVGRRIAPADFRRLLKDGWSR